MLFSTFSYALFLPILFFLYWFVVNKSLKIQNFLLLLASYFFYSFWDVRFLFLLLFSTLLDYFCAIQIDKSENTNIRKVWFWNSIIVNLSFLGVFKYFNFFIGSFQDIMNLFGFKINVYTLNIILPVGISFYTFHGLSYIIDVYKKRIKPENEFITYSVFVCYFPLLVAGPIERATHLLPQIKKQRIFNYSQAIDGLYQILWGLFKKIVIADNCAQFVNVIFTNPQEYSGSTLLVGAIFFSFQIYGDFSGYSDIALGSSKLFGITLLQNFSFPYFSRDIAEFWRRWHISLSSWFKDYLYIPLGGSKVGKMKQMRNTFIIFLVSGFWHGANWTFIIWGLLNAVYFLPLLLLNSNRNHIDIVAPNKLLPSFKDVFQIIITFIFITFAWIFFRSNSIPNAFQYIKGIFSKSLFSLPQIRPFYLFVLLILFITVEWLGRKNHYALGNFSRFGNKIIRWPFVIFLIVIIFIFGTKEQQFIYFQF